MSISMFETRRMMRMLEQRKPPRSFLRDTFIKETLTSDAEAVDIDIVKNKRKMAPFVHPLIEGKVIEREGYQTKTIKPAYIKQKRVTTAEDVLRRSPGENIYAAKSPEQRAMETLARDMRDLDELIARREEWMVAKALFTGQIPIKGEGVDQVVDFGYEAGVHKITLSTGSKWGDSGVNPMSDLYEWATEVGQRSGLTSNIAILGSGAAEALLASVDAKAFDYRRVDMGEISPRTLPNGVQYIGHFRRPDIDLYQYNEWYLDDDTGVETPMVPVNAVLLASTAARCTMHYGAIKDLSALYAAPRFVKSWTKEDPSARLLLMQSAPLFNPVQVDGFTVVTVK